MKQFYFIIAFFCISFSFGQDARSDGEIDGFKLYPNPVTEGKVYVSTTDNALKQVYIYDVLGTEVLKTSISGAELRLTTLDPGVYVLRVSESNKVATRKLIIK